MSERLEAFTDYILERLGENSTWRGFVLILTGLGVVLKPDRIDAIIAIGLGIVGLINVARRGPPSKDEVAQALEKKQDKL